MSGVEVLTDPEMLGMLQVRIRGDDRASLLLRFHQDILVCEKVGEPKRWIATVLLASEEVSLTPDPKIFTSDLESVTGLAKGPQPL